MLYLQCDNRKAGEHSPSHNFINDNHRSEFKNNIEIQQAFKTPAAYREAVYAMVKGSHRKEWTIRDNQDTIALLVTVECPDIHYQKLSAAIVLWIKPEYRGIPQVAKLMVEAQRQSAIQSNCDYMVRTSKLTPFITKQIVRRVK